ncbi:CsbD family protein [Corynebacterium sp. 13CS0277]|uniref:CsbD family protein n=1 Tax=Corynebacterium sp. 13CS0277 TaxID=2071994 RepID=UPI000D036652|nr:CsbD family protein [Corynebacterium sp. 13CS0277]PRQ10301.1 CsbD family protein [Corynebacterium sp. 13CS0277]
MSDIENKAEELGGKAKEAFGEATGNERVANEGRADQVKAEVKDALEDAGDAIKGAADKVLGAFKKDA